MYVGAYLNDDLWFAFVPDEYFVDHVGGGRNHHHHHPLPPHVAGHGIARKDTRLTQTRVKICHLFWCHLLHSMAFRGVTIGNGYKWGIGDDINAWEIRDICNIL